MTVLKNTRTGRYSTDADEVMTHVRKPVFVDNAIHHGRISVQKANKAKVTVEKKNTRNLQVMPQRNYRILEGNRTSSCRITIPPVIHSILPLSLLMI